MGFLLSPEDLSDYDFDEFVRLIIYIRQCSLGIGPQQVKDGNGKVICEYNVPKLYIDLDKCEKDTDEARRRFALYLL